MFFDYIRWGGKNSELELNSEPFPSKPQCFYLPSAEEMKAADSYSISLGVSSIELMERAANEVLDAICDRFPNSEPQILCLCGPGNNGGDGIAVARLALERNLRAEVYFLNSKSYSPDFIKQAEAYRSVGGELFLLVSAEADKAHKQLGSLDVQILSVESLLKKIEFRSVVLDALFGISQRFPLPDIVVDLSKQLQVLRETIPFSSLALDCPSGVDTDTGRVASGVIPAQFTIAIQNTKRGLVQYPALEFCGQIEVRDIGVEYERTPYFSILSPHVLSLRSRESQSHKGENGRLGVFAGSSGMPGAAELSTMAAARAGAGLVFLDTRAEFSPNNLAPEVIRREADSSFFEDKVNSVLYGPGLGDPEKRESELKGVIDFCRDSKTPLTLDADGLNTLSMFPLSLEGVMSVLTPHPGEAARLLNCSSAEVNDDRYGAALQIQRRYGAVVILKGASTVIASDGQGVVDLLGNPLLATAGTGDILAGFCSSFLAQKYKPYEAAKLSVFLHSFCSRILLEQSNAPIIASDLLTVFREAYARLQNFAIKIS
jgi:NAD(P)H-hydrate epimerase